MTSLSDDDPVHLEGEARGRHLLLTAFKIDLHTRGLED